MGLWRCHSVPLKGHQTRGFKIYWFQVSVSLLHSSIQLNLRIGEKNIFMNKLILSFRFLSAPFLQCQKDLISLFFVCKVKGNWIIYGFALLLEYLFNWICISSFALQLINHSNEWNSHSGSYTLSIKRYEKFLVKMCGHRGPI